MALVNKKLQNNEIKNIFITFIQIYLGLQFDPQSMPMPPVANMPRQWNMVLMTFLTSGLSLQCSLPEHHIVGICRPFQYSLEKQTPEWPQFNYDRERLI